MWPFSWSMDQLPETHGWQRDSRDTTAEVSTSVGTMSESRKCPSMLEFYSGSNDHTRRFWCINRPGDLPCDNFNTGYNQGFDEHNPALEDRVPSNFPVPHGQSTPRPLTTGLPRNEGTVPGFGDAMPLSIPFIDTSDQGEGQQQSFPISMPVRAPLLPLGPHPSLLSPGGSYQQSHHMPQMQPPPSHFLPHSHLSCPSPMAVPQLPPTPGQMGMQSSTSRRVPAMPQGHMMSMNLMHSGWEPANALQQPPHGGYANGIPTIQGPSDPALSRSIQPQTTCSNVNGSST